jgi:hypothetical protein
MKTLVAGLVLGLLLGTAAQAGAQYLHGAFWYRMDRQAQTAYVAGVVDALESLTGFAERVGADRAIEQARVADRCAGRVPPSRLADVGDRAIQRAPSYAPPSTAIIVGFVACGSRSYGWGPNARPPLYNEQPTLHYGQPPSNRGWNEYDSQR